jgi:hypothetical protein
MYTLEFYFQSFQPLDPKDQPIFQVMMMERKESTLGHPQSDSVPMYNSRQNGLIVPGT